MTFPKRTNVMDLVYHIKSGIQFDAVFDVQSNSCFESVDYR